MGSRKRPRGRFKTLAKFSWIAWFSTGTVSYTHLDVYKRQTQGRGALRHAPGVPAGLLKHHIVLCKDAGLLAEVYGLMIFSRCELWPLESFTEAQREAFLRWHPPT